MNIRGKSISFSAYKKKTTDSKEKNLIEDIASLEKQNIQNTDSLETKKIELENIRKIKMQGQLIRSKAQWCQFGEKPSKYFCNLEAYNFSNKIIPKIEKENGDIIEEQLS